jgi:CRP-like cAMP-binding protein
MDLAEGRVLSLLPYIETSYFEAGDVICEKGRIAPPWLHLLSGVVSAYSDGPRRTGVSTGMCGPGSWLGDPGFITQQPSPCTLVALTASRALSVPHELALKAFEEDIGFSRYLARMVLVRSAHKSDMLLLLKAASPHLRIFAGLAMLAHSILLGKSQLQQDDVVDVLEIPVKQEALASVLGVSRGTFSECVQHLSKAGWVKLTYASISMVQVAAWIQCWEAYRQNDWISPKVKIDELMAHMRASLPAQELDALLGGGKASKPRKRPPEKPANFDSR